MGSFSESYIDPNLLMFILIDSKLVIFSPSTTCIFITFSYKRKSCRFSFQTLANFEAAKTGSGVECLRLTAVRERSDLKSKNIGLPVELRMPCLQMNDQRQATLDRLRIRLRPASDQICADSTRKKYIF